MTRSLAIRLLCLPILLCLFGCGGRTVNLDGLTLGPGDGARILTRNCTTETDKDIRFCLDLAGSLSLGESLNLPIMVQTPVGLEVYEATIRISYDSSKVEFTGQALPLVGVRTKIIKNNPGFLEIKVDSQQSIKTSATDGVAFLTLEFQSLDLGEAVFAIGSDPYPRGGIEGGGELIPNEHVGTTLSIKPEIPSEEQ